MQHPVEILPSRFLALILFAAHGLALLAVFTALPAWAAAACVLPLGASLAYYLLRDAGLRLGASCIGLASEGEGMTIQLRNGVRLPCVVLKDSVVTPLLTVLRLRPEGLRMARSVVILPDSMDTESFRALRVWLKWGGAAAGSPDRAQAQAPDGS